MHSFPSKNKNTQLSANKSFVEKKARNDATKDLGKGQNQVKCEETAIRHS